MYTQNPGCISKQICFIPSFSAKAACFVQYGISFSSHCHFTISEKSVGHGHVTQFGCFASSLSPGHPENVTTRSTPSAAASRTARRQS